MLDVLQALYSFPVYPVCFAYCVWRIVKRSKKTSLDGVIGDSMESEVLGLLFLAPIVAIIDIFLTALKYVRK